MKKAIKTGNITTNAFKTGVMLQLLFETPTNAWQCFYKRLV